MSGTLVSRGLGCSIELPCRISFMFGVQMAPLLPQDPLERVGGEARHLFQVPYKFIGCGAMDATEPNKFVGFGAMDATEPYKFIGFGAMDATEPYKFIGFGAMDATEVRLRIPGSGYFGDLGKSWSRVWVHPGH